MLLQVGYGKCHPGRLSMMRRHRPVAEEGDIPPLAGTGQDKSWSACCGPEMKLPAAVLSCVFAATAVSMAGPKIAIVRVADVYKSLESSRIQQDAVEKERQDITKDRRLTDLQTMVTELKAKQEAIGTLSGPVVDEATQKKIREYALQYREAETLRETYATFQEEENKRINTKLVKEMRASLDQIHETACKIGKDEGFDWVLDTSGNSNTGIPLVLYAKAPVDLTEKVLLALQPSPSAGTHTPATPPSAGSAPTPETEPAPAAPDTQR